jgi:hypothetical protein
MKMQARWVFCALTIGCAFSAGADYSWQLAGRVEDGETAGPVTSETNGLSLSATYHFDPVEEGAGPNALAAFLDPASLVSLTVSRDEDTSAVSAPAGAAPLVADRDGNARSVSGRYLLPRSKWYVGGRYSRGELDPPPAVPQLTASSADLQGYGLVAGKYLGAGGATRLQLALERSRIDNDVTVTLCILACFTGTADAEATTDDVRLDVMHVGRVRSAAYAVSGGVSEGNISAAVSALVLTGPGGLLPPVPSGTAAELDLGTVRSYSVGGELYPRPNVGVRVGYTELDTPGSDGDRVDVGASWFFRSNVGLELTLSRESPDDGFDTDRTALRVIGRF